jgi:hypothetical protein
MHDFYYTSHVENAIMRGNDSHIPRKVVEFRDAYEGRSTYTSTRINIKTYHRLFSHQDIRHMTFVETTQSICFGFLRMLLWRTALSEFVREAHQ